MSPVAKTYQDLYSALSELREHLHSSGRLDDSNAKLDELVKVLAICIAGSKGWIDDSKVQALLDGMVSQKNVVTELKKIFSSCVKLEQFKNMDGSSIFGANPALNLQDSEGEFATLLLKSVYTSFQNAAQHVSDGQSFDLLNEAFGHFVRDNFRGNIEDAQYMTPPEVVDFVCEWALTDVLKENPKALDKKFIVMDPSCGVGSFLASFYTKAVSKNKKFGKYISLIGQDKVDRMVRLSKVNMMLFSSENHTIEHGNSLVGNKFIESYNGKVDLILTNPPFGAKIPSTTISAEPKSNYPLLNDAEKLSNSVDSELLFIDREISLLKNGGKLFVVVPDSTISSRGLAETLRNRISRYAELKGVVELPSVTFAQAGTRTKTSILYIEKKSNPSHKNLCVMASIESLGFQVSMRKGVAVKKHEGTNELEILKENLFKSKNERGIVQEFPSCIKEFSENVIRGTWTASHYSAKKLMAETRLSEIDGAEPKRLIDLVEIQTKQRRRLKEEVGSKCISVLHIIGDGLINFRDLYNYEPKTKGNVCYPGDVLISKINPRITRVLVVPDLGFPTTCSNEFEIMVPKKGIDPYWVAYMLQENLVQDQIQSLTSGTSSSHNRIKTSELEKIVIPFPSSEVSKTETKRRMKAYKSSIISLIDSSYAVFKMREKMA